MNTAGLQKDRRAVADFDATLIRPLVTAAFLRDAPILSANAAAGLTILAV
jgi:hypothetical protein